MSWSVRKIVFLLGAISTAAYSQTATGSISGSVGDPSTAAVVGAKVVLTNTANNESRSIANNSLGYYSFPLLPRCGCPSKISVSQASSLVDSILPSGSKCRSTECACQV